MAKRNKTGRRNRFRQRKDLPDSICGDFFVLSYNAESEHYTLSTETDQGIESYELGTEKASIKRYLMQNGMSDESSGHAIAASREAKSAQIIKDGWRIIPICPRGKRKIDVFQYKQQKSALPPLC